MPPLPPWEGLHPLLVHLPIGLWLGIPVLLACAVRRRPWAIGLRWGTLALMALATLGAWLAVESGEAAAEMADRTPEINIVMAEHAELAETTLWLMALTTAAWGATLMYGSTPAARRSQRALPLRIGWLVAWGLYGAALYFLVQAGHRGGLLVHRHGVLALMPAAPETAE